MNKQLWILKNCRFASENLQSIFAKAEQLYSSGDIQGCITQLKSLITQLESQTAQAETQDPEISRVKHILQPVWNQLPQSIQNQNNPFNFYKSLILFHEQNKTSPISSTIKQALATVGLKIDNRLQVGMKYNDLPDELRRYFDLDKSDRENFDPDSSTIKQIIYNRWVKDDGQQTDEWMSPLYIV